MWVSTPALQINLLKDCWTVGQPSEKRQHLWEIKKKKDLPSVLIFLALTHVSTQLSLHSLSSFGWWWIKGGERDRRSVIKLFNWWKEAVTLPGLITCKTHFDILMGVHCRFRWNDWRNEGLTDPVTLSFLMLYIWNWHQFALIHFIPATFSFIKSST